MGDLLSGISFLCFAASYTVSLALEISRLWFRSGFRGFLMLGFAGAGLLAQTLFLISRAGQDLQLGHVPLSSAFDWYLIAAWVLIVGHLVLTIQHPRVPMGLFLLPLVLLCLGAAYRFADRTPFADDRALQTWGALHGICLLLGAVSVTFGCVTGLMYLLQAYRLKTRHGPRPGLQLPSLEWLERMGGRAIVWSTVCVGIGLASGIVLNLVSSAIRDDPHPQVAWSDPVVWTSAAMFVWLVAAALFSHYYKPAQQGRKIAYLTVSSFVFLIFHLSVSLLANSEHGRRDRPRSEAPVPSQAVPLPPSSSFVAQDVVDPSA